MRAAVIFSTLFSLLTVASPTVADDNFWVRRPGRDLGHWRRSHLETFSLRRLQGGRQIPSLTSSTPVKRAWITMSELGTYRPFMARLT